MDFIYGLIIVAVSVLLFNALIFDMFRGIKKKIFQNQVEEVKSNIWELGAPYIDKFGYLPMFELQENCVFVVQAEPKGRLFSDIKSKRYKWNGANPRVVKHNINSDWVYLYNPIEKWGSRIRGCIIYTNRLDEFKVSYSTNDGVNLVNITYDVNITAEIEDPGKFYRYLKLSEQGGDLKEKIIDHIRKLIEEKQDKERRMDININGTTGFELEALNDAGYRVEEYSIRYDDRKVEKKIHNNSQNGHGSNGFDSLFST